MGSGPQYVLSQLNADGVPEAIGPDNPLYVGPQAPPAVPSNHSGQVKVTYTGLSLTGFTDSVNQTYDIAAATPALSTFPTTTWPIDSPGAYNPDFFNVTTNRLRENNKPGQVSTWRIDGAFSAKGAGNNGALSLELFNPDSGFVNTQTVTLPSSSTANSWTVNLLTIADPASLAAGRGYQVRARTSFTDANIVFTINSITRVSHAVENAY